MKKIIKLRIAQPNEVEGMTAGDYLSLLTGAVVGENGTLIPPVQELEEMINEALSSSDYSRRFSYFDPLRWELLADRNVSARDPLLSLYPDVANAIWDEHGQCLNAGGYIQIKKN